MHGKFPSNTGVLSKFPSRLNPDPDLTVFHPALGGINLWGNIETGLVRLGFDQSITSERQITSLTPVDHFLSQSATRLLAYLDGEKVNLSRIRTQPHGTPFQKKVWAMMATIPYGETRSYQWIATMIQTPQACRAVAKALGQNPVPIVLPCHRVIQTNGELGGFHFGLQMKRYLLALEADAYGTQLPLAGMERTLIPV